MHKKKRKNGGLLVRFAMPRDGKCTGCNTLVAAGVRFNAVKKDRPGEAYSFDFHCPHCRTTLVVSTDPKRAAFVFEHPLAEMQSFLAQQRALETAPPPQEQLPLTRLERAREQAALFKRELRSVAADDARAKRVRAALRSERRVKTELAKEGAKRGLAIALVPETPTDRFPVAASARSQPQLLLLGPAPVPAPKVELSVVRKVRKASPTPDAAPSAAATL
jgi:hypothetical protein